MRCKKIFFKISKCSDIINRNSWRLLLGILQSHDWPLRKVAHKMLTEPWKPMKTASKSMKSKKNCSYHWNSCRQFVRHFAQRPVMRLQYAQKQSTGFAIYVVTTFWYLKIYFFGSCFFCLKISQLGVKMNSISWISLI